MLIKLLVWLWLKARRGRVGGCRAFKLGGKVYLLTLEEFQSAQSLIQQAEELGILDSMQTSSEHPAS